MHTCRDCKLAKRDFQQLGSVVRLVDYWTGAALAEQQLLAAQQLLASLLPPTTSARLPTVCVAYAELGSTAKQDGKSAIIGSKATTIKMSNAIVRACLQLASQCRASLAQLEHLAMQPQHMQGCSMLPIHAGHVREQRQLRAGGAAVHARRAGGAARAQRARAAAGPGYGPGAPAALLLACMHVCLLACASVCLRRPALALLQRVSNYCCSKPHANGRQPGIICVRASCLCPPAGCVSSAACSRQQPVLTMACAQSLPRLLSMRALSPLFGNRRPSSLSMLDIMQCALACLPACLHPAKSEGTVSALHPCTHWRLPWLAAA